MNKKQRKKNKNFFSITKGVIDKKNKYDFSFIEIFSY